MWKTFTIIGSAAVFACIGLAAGCIGHFAGDELMFATVFGALGGLGIAVLAIGYAKEK